jgi:hypothetical protein
MQKVVTNQGSGIVNKSDAGGITGVQAGDRTERYRRCGTGVSPVNSRLVEVRDGSAQTLGQFVYGTQYIDEPGDPPLTRRRPAPPDRSPRARGAALRPARQGYDRNTDVGTDDDCLDAGSAAYFYHQPLTRGVPRRGTGRGATAGPRPGPRVKGQDWNYRVVMLTHMDGAVVERCVYERTSQAISVRSAMFACLYA